MNDDRVRVKGRQRERMGDKTKKQNSDNELGWNGVGTRTRKTKITGRKKKQGRRTRKLRDWGWEVLECVTGWVRNNCNDL